jgi:hypothetical protein
MVIRVETVVFFSNFQGYKKNYYLCDQFNAIEWISVLEKR